MNVYKRCDVNAEYHTHQACNQETYCKANDDDEHCGGLWRVVHEQKLRFRALGGKSRASEKFGSLKLEKLRGDARKPLVGRLAPHVER